MLESVKIYLTGQAEGSAIETAMKDWMRENDASIKQGGLVPYLDVSSWAVVVDIKWKKDFTAVRNYNPADDTVVPSSITDLNYQLSGSVGDSIGILMNVKDQSFL